MSGMPTIERFTTTQERAELETVLSSPAFVRSPTHAHFLSYLCEKTFAGESDQIKEYSIALEVFGRRDSFDQDTDSIVRVQANRLRKRLAEYYRSEGAGHSLQIVIPVGQYVPRFEPKTRATSVGNDGPQESAKESVHALSWTHSTFVVLAALFLCVTLVATAVRFGQREKPQAPSSLSPTISSLAEQPTGLPVGDEIRVLAGAARSYVDRAGKLWTPDRYFTGGKAVRSSVQHIWRTQDPSIYRSSRQGDFHYDIPLKPGIYELRLHFAETFYGPEEIGSGGEGSRVMTARVNGKLLLDDFDVLLDAGGSRTADIKVFTGVSPAPDGELHLVFSSLRGGSATLSAVEILPGLRGGQRPVRISTRDVPYYSNDSLWWGPDDYFRGGQFEFHR
jgi:Malectin domain